MWLEPREFKETKCASEPEMSPVWSFTKEICDLFFRPSQGRTVGKSHHHVGFTRSFDCFGKAS